MDPCPFVRILVGNLALRIPVAARPSRSGVHPSTTPCYCKIKLGKLPPQTAPVPLAQQQQEGGTAGGAPAEQQQQSPAGQGLAASFDLGPADLYGGKKNNKKNQPQQQQQKNGKSGSGSSSRVMVLKVEIYTGRRGTTCGLSSGRLLGKVTVPVDLEGAAEGGRGCIFHNGWVSIGGGRSGTGAPATSGSSPNSASSSNSPTTSSSSSPHAEVHLTVRSEPDPRFVFEFDGEPECSPQVFQVQGAMRQPVFTCKFSCRNPSSADHRSLSMQADYGGSSRGIGGVGGASGWLRGSFGALSSDRDQRGGNGKERKGWSVTVHDLSGSPVALASMVTPFVASPGSDRVSRSNPGAWLILRPGDGTWKPWGRLEAWRERGGSSDGLGCRFELLPDASGAAMDGSGVLLAEATLNARKGGKFSIDLGSASGSASFGQNNNSHYHVGRSRSSRSGSRSATPGCSPRGSGDLAGLLQHPAFGSGSHFRGFVMSSTVQGEGKCSKPGVEIGVQNVGCAEDAAAFVALAAAVDLSMDACKLFSQKLRKELSHHQQEQML